jgi:mRNA interferase RelE/StbE
LNYQVHILRSAEKEMDRLPATVHARLCKRILSLEDNPRPRGVKKLSGREEYRLRVGDYRILYVIDDGNHTVTIVAVGHRREVYG